MHGLDMVTDPVCTDPRLHMTLKAAELEPDYAQKCRINERGDDASDLLQRLHTPAFVEPEFR